MNGWKTGTLREACNISTGFAFKGDQYEPSGNLRVVRGENVTIGALRWDSEKHWNHSSAGLENYFLAANDIVIGMDGSRVGHNRAKIRAVDLPLILAQRVARLRAKNGIDQDFIWYQIIDDRFKDYVEAIHTGTSIPHISMNQIGDYEVTLPPLHEQKTIAAVLSSLDDKIELLHRQNKTLEAMAETLFRQWFVEEAQEDWEEVTLSDVTTRITDGAHASPPTVEVGLPMASVKDMYQWGINKESCRQISQDDFDELVRTDCRPLKNDILIAKDGSYLKHVFVAEEDMDVVILSSIAILRPNGKYHPLLLATFLKLESTRDGLANIVTGAVIPRIVLKDFRKYKLLLPPQPLQDQAIATIQPIYEKCWENDRQIRTLEKLRDTLLPKLMSGEVRIEI